MTQELPLAVEFVSDRMGLAAGLTAIRQRADLSIRELSRRIDVPAATLGGYFSGRNLPQAGQLTGLRRALSACGLDARQIERWLDAVERVRTSTAAPFVRPAAPYPGLSSFGIDDAAVFFGRTAETDEILENLKSVAETPGGTRHVLAVIGPSGSGKTSLLRAGVAARLRDGGRSCVVATPGDDPIAVLHDAVATFGDGPGVLVLDQFEEVFTVGPEPADLSRFLDELMTLDPRIAVVLGMRADFYATAAGHAQLVPVLQHGQFLLGPLGRTELGEAIARPAVTVGMTVADGLVDLVLADLAPRDSPGEPHDAGALPLLSHALRTAWDEGVSGPELTPADYRAAGGIDGAIARTAEDAFASVGADRWPDARRLFVRLVTIDDVAVSRRRITGAEFAALRDADSTRVVDEFVARRLLTLGDGSLEISHEALLSAWPRLREWIDEDRIGLKLHRQVTEAANSWEQSGRDDALLLRGGRLEAAGELVSGADAPVGLNRLEHEFVAAGIAARDAAAERSRRGTRRLRRLLAAVVVLLVAAAGLATYALRARSAADAAETDAAGSRDLAVSRQIAGQAGQLQASDPALAQQLALVAYRSGRSDLARSALVDQSSQPTITRVLGAQGPTPVAISAGASPMIAVGHADDGSVHLYRLVDGRPVAVSTVPARDAAPNQVYALRFSRDRTLLAVGGQSRTVRLWNVSDPRRPRPIATLPTRFTGDVQAVDFSPDGSLLAAGSIGPAAVRVWDVRAPAAPRTRPVPTLTTPDTTVSSVRFSPDGARLVAGALDGTVLSWQVDGTTLSGGRKAKLGESGVVAVAWTPDAATILTGTRQGDVQPLRAGTLVSTHARVRVSAGYVNGIDVTPDGHRFVIASSDTAVSQWSLPGYVQLSTQGNPGPVTGVAYLDRGRTLVSAAADGTTRVYPASPGIAADATVFNLAQTADGSRLAVATGGDGSGVRIWDVRTPERPTLLSPLIAMPPGTGSAAATVSLTPDGMVLAVASRTGYLALWDVRTPARPRLLGPAVRVVRDGLQVESTAFTSDGSVLAVGGDDNSVRLVDVSDPTRVRQLSSMSTHGLVFNVAFSPDDRFVVAASADEHGYVWDVSEPRRPRRTATLGGFVSYAYSVAVSPDGRTVAVGSADHTTRLWRLSATGRTTPVGQPLIGPAGYVFGLSFSPDGTRLATASDDNAIRVYDVSRPAPARVPELTLDAGGNSMYTVLYSADGRSLYGGGRGSTLSMWTTDVNRYATRLCATIGTRITRDEWAINVPGAPYDPPCG